MHGESPRVNCSREFPFSTGLAKRRPGRPSKADIAARKREQARTYPGPRVTPESVLLESNSKLRVPPRGVRGVLVGVYYGEYKEKLLVFGAQDKPRDPKDRKKQGIIPRVRFRLHALDEKMVPFESKTLHNIREQRHTDLIPVHEISELESHLQGLNEAELRSYVKCRHVEGQFDKTVEGKERADKAALERIERRSPKAPSLPFSAADHPSVDSLQAWSSDFNLQHAREPTPEIVNVSRPYAPPGTIVDGADIEGVLLGYWSESPEELLQDKHACYGIIGNGGILQAIVRHITRDGRRRCSKLPTVLGLLCVPFKCVTLDPCFMGASRESVRRYVRSRRDEYENNRVSTEGIIEVDGTAASCQAASDTELLNIDSLEINSTARPQTTNTDAGSMEFNTQPSLYQAVSNAEPPGTARLRMPIDSPIGSLKNSMIRERMTNNDAGSMEYRAPPSDLQAASNPKLQGVATLEAGSTASQQTTGDGADGMQVNSAISPTQVEAKRAEIEREAWKEMFMQRARDQDKAEGEEMTMNFGTESVSGKIKEGFFSGNLKTIPRGDDPGDGWVVCVWAKKIRL